MPLSKDEFPFFVILLNKEETTPLLTETNPPTNSTTTKKKKKKKKTKKSSGDDTNNNNNQKDQNSMDSKKLFGSDNNIVSKKIDHYAANNNNLASHKSISLTQNQMRDINERGDVNRWDRNRSSYSYNNDEAPSLNAFGQMMSGKSQTLSGSMAQDSLTHGGHGDDDHSRRFGTLFGKNSSSFGQEMQTYSNNNRDKIDFDSINLKGDAPKLQNPNSQTSNNNNNNDQNNNNNLSKNGKKKKRTIKQFKEEKAKKEREETQQNTKNFNPTQPHSMLDTLSFSRSLNFPDHDPYHPSIRSCYDNRGYGMYASRNQPQTVLAERLPQTKNGDFIQKAGPSESYNPGTQVANGLFNGMLLQNQQQGAENNNNKSGYDGATNKYSQEVNEALEKNNQNRNKQNSGDTNNQEPEIQDEAWMFEDGKIPEKQQDKKKKKRGKKGTNTNNNNSNNTPQRDLSLDNTSQKNQVTKKNSKNSNSNKNNNNKNKVGKTKSTESNNSTRKASLTTQNSKDNYNDDQISVTSQQTNKNSTKNVQEIQSLVDYDNSDTDNNDNMTDGDFTTNKANNENDNSSQNADNNNNDDNEKKDLQESRSTSRASGLSEDEFLKLAAEKKNKELQLSSTTTNKQKPTTAPIRIKSPNLSDPEDADDDGFQLVDGSNKDKKDKTSSMNYRNIFNKDSDNPASKQTRAHRERVEREIAEREARLAEKLRVSNQIEENKKQKQQNINRIKENNNSNQNNSGSTLSFAPPSVTPKITPSQGNSANSDNNNSKTSNNPAPVMSSWAALARKKEVKKEPKVVEKRSDISSNLSSNNLTKFPELQTTNQSTNFNTITNNNQSSQPSTIPATPNDIRSKTNSISNSSVKSASNQSKISAVGTTTSFDQSSDEESVEVIIDQPIINNSSAAVALKHAIQNNQNSLHSQSTTSTTSLVSDNNNKNNLSNHNSNNNTSINNSPIKQTAVSTTGSSYKEKISASYSSNSENTIIANPSSLSYSLSIVSDDLNRNQTQVLNNNNNNNDSDVELSNLGLDHKKSRCSSVENGKQSSIGSRDDIYRSLGGFYFCYFCKQTSFGTYRKVLPILSHLIDSSILFKIVFLTNLAPTASITSPVALKLVAS